MSVSTPQPAAAPAPVTAPPEQPGRVVVGVDGSPGSIEALRWVGRIATALGATIEAVSAWQYPSNYSMPIGMTEDSVEDAYVMILAKAVDTAFGTTTPAGLFTRVEEGFPAQVLLTVSAEPDVEMLVVGSRGHGGSVGRLIGSTSAYCAEHASCPVIVVHHRQSSAQ